MIILGHRGASGHHEENTLTAFRAAYDEGATGSEFDVRRCRDGVIVVHHDPMLADGRFIIDLDAHELPEWVPTLRDVLRTWCELTPTPVLNIEIKSVADQPDFDPTYPVVDAVVADVLKARAEGCPDAVFVISSFDRSAVNRARHVGPSIMTAFLTETPLSPAELDSIRHDGHVGVMVDFQLLTPETVASMRARDLMVGAWTVNEPDDINRMAALDVDYLMTDYPRRAVELLRDA